MLRPCLSRWLLHQRQLLVIEVCLHELLRRGGVLSDFPLPAAVCADDVLICVTSALAMFLILWVVIRICDDF